MSLLLGWVKAAASGWKSQEQIAADPGAWRGGGWSVATQSGQRVGPERALGLSTYFACIRNIGDDVGKLPLGTFRRLATRGKEPAPEHPSYSMLKTRANPYMSSMTARQTLTAWSKGWGRGIAEIVRDERGFARQYWPIHPSRICPKFEDGEMFYDISTDDLELLSSTARKTPRRLRAEDVIHIHGLGDGYDGYSVAQLAAQAIGTGLAAELQAASYYGNGITLSGVLQHPGKLNESAQKNILKSLMEPHQGATKAWDVFIAEEGMTFKDAPRISPRDAQAIEGRYYTVEDVCRWFRMPPHKAGHLQRSTNNNIEHQGIEYVTDCILTEVIQWEQELQAKVFLGDPDHFAEHNILVLLRGDSAARGEFYSKAISAGWLSPDDVRELENMNPIPGGFGAKYYMNGTMAPLELLAQGSAVQGQPSTAQALALVHGRNGNS